MALWTTANFDFSAQILDDEWLIYHPGSGETHRLAGLASFIFALLWQEKLQLDVNQLRDLLCFRYELKLEENQIMEALLNLAANNLIEDIQHSG